ncbi:MAG: hypothetical protein WDN46_14915 [Methylocella sp.]
MPDEFQKLASTQKRLKQRSATRRRAKERIKAQQSTISALEQQLRQTFSREHVDILCETITRKNVRILELETALQRIRRIAGISANIMLSPKRIGTWNAQEISKQFHRIIDRSVIAIKTVSQAA